MGRDLVIIAGPTGVGKSNLAVELAKRCNGEIVSCDSMQIYQGLDIGSAKVTQSQRQGIAHHLLDIVDPKAEFSVAEFRDRALSAILTIQAKGKLPILTGGTGLFINSIIYRMNFGEAIKSDSIRASYELIAKEQGNGALHQILQEKDPSSAGRIHANNVKRVIRALEVLSVTGRPFSDYRDEKQLNSDFDIYYYWISCDRVTLYENIDQRVDGMMTQGLLDEVKRLKDSGLTRDDQSMQGIGYKEILEYLDGKITLNYAVELIKQRSRNYAKRQMTWFRNDENSQELSKELMTEPQMLFKIESDLQILK